VVVKGGGIRSQGKACSNKKERWREGENLPGGGTCSLEGWGGGYELTKKGEADRQGQVRFGQAKGGQGGEKKVVDLTQGAKGKGSA